MFDGLYSEFIKLKRIGYYTGILALSLVSLPLFTFEEEVLSLNWYGYFFNFEFTAFTFVFTLVIPIIISLIFVREFKYKTASIAFSYPNGRLGGLINKFIVSTLIIAAIYVMAYLFVVISGVIFLKAPITWAPLINHLKIFLTSFIFQVALIPLIALVALIGKNMIVSFIYSILLLIGNLSYFLESSYSDFMFSRLPALPILKLGVPIYLDPVNIEITKFEIYLGLCVFLIGLVGSIIFYKKADIY
ncbi:ABC transporter permease [Dethiothermospora halolimnae]|uniref:ABC transporter permease n=1 Tax=Dethiothermospora halolimnae TaxID=3114390 RepID=UPI003CCB9450